MRNKRPLRKRRKPKASHCREPQDVTPTVVLAVGAWHHVKPRVWESSGLRFRITRRHHRFLLEDLKWPRRTARKYDTLQDAKNKADEKLRLEGAW